MHPPPCADQGHSSERGAAREGLVGLFSGLSQLVERVDLSNLLHTGRDYQNHKMILIDKFLPSFSVWDNMRPQGVI